MVPELRKSFNGAFTPKLYEDYVAAIHNLRPGFVEFRIAETPVFIPKIFKEQLITACEQITDVILRPDFKEITQKAIPQKYNIPNETSHPEFICFDFGICEDGAGNFIPQLIEMQGFPSLFGYQYYQDLVCRQFFKIPENYRSYLGGFNEQGYVDLFRNIILNGHKAEEVILLEIFPEKQKTRIDFACTEDLTGIRPVCYTRLKSEGEQLYYEMENGEKQFIKRIYNRLIFDDLEKQELPATVIDLNYPWKVEWCPHPNWFYRVSKFTLPFIDSEYVPKTLFLNEVVEMPSNLEDFVLKPLFSFAGQGVIIDLTPEDITAIPDPENWILQKKVKYADAIITPDVPAKAEIRIFYFWPPDAVRPFPVQNLGRLSKGKMIGVRYNIDREWVGGTNNYFED